jgi:hypothetical protein
MSRVYHARRNQNVKNLLLVILAEFTDRAQRMACLAVAMATVLSSYQLHAADDAQTLT